MEFLESIRKGVESIRVVNKNATQFRSFCFGLGGGSRGVTHFCGSSLALTFEFCRISKTNLTSVEYLKKHFLNHHACFFLEQTTDKQVYLLF